MKMKVLEGVRLGLMIWVLSRFLGRERHGGWYYLLLGKSGVSSCLTSSLSSMAIPFLSLAHTDATTNKKLTFYTKNIGYLVSFSKLLCALVMWVVQEWSAKGISMISTKKITIYTFYNKNNIFLLEKKEKKKHDIIENISIFLYLWINKLIV